MIRVGSIWTSSDSKMFEVKNVETRDDNIWVSYFSEDREYECLAGAFLNRFKEVLV